MKSVAFETYTRLGCSCGAEVVICVDEELTASGAPYIEGTIVSIDSYLDSQGRTYYTYVFTFEEGQLADPEHVLLTCEITGAFCKNCLTDYIDYLITTVTPPTPTDYCSEEPVASGIPLVCSSGSEILPLACGDLGDVLTVTSVDPCVAEWQAPAGGDFWALTGNAGTVDGVNFIGTTDDVAHDVRVNNIRARRTEPALFIEGILGTANIVDGHSDNYIDSGESGSAILSGGEEAADANKIKGFTGVRTGSGDGNNLICGGAGNEMYGYDQEWEIYLNIIVGGGYNIISVDTGLGSEYPHAEDYYAVYENFVGGGGGNGILGTGGNSSVVGGSGNWIQALVDLLPVPLWIRDHYGSVIAGGSGNAVLGSDSSGIVAGDGAEIIRSIGSVVCGGGAGVIGKETLAYVHAYLDYDCVGCFIGAGDYNEITGVDACGIVVGSYNQIFTSSTSLSVWAQDTSAILCGWYNKIDTNPTNSANYYGLSSILGGAGLFVGARTIGFQLAVKATKGIVSPAPTYTDLTAFKDLFYCGNADFWVGNVDSVARKIKWFEPNATVNYSGTHYSSIEAQAQEANIEYKLPAAAGVAGQVLKIQGVVGTVVTLEWANDLT